MNAKTKPSDIEEIEEYYFLAVKLGFMLTTELPDRFNHGPFSGILNPEEKKLILESIISRVYEFVTMKTKNLMSLYESMIINYEDDEYARAVCGAILEEFRLRDIKFGIK